MGVRIAFDVGTVRIGVATSDPHGILASPQEAIAAGDESIAAAIGRISHCAADEVYVGLPRTMKGRKRFHQDGTRMGQSIRGKVAAASYID